MQGSLCFFSMALLSWGENWLKCLSGVVLILVLGFFCCFILALFVCFSFKSLTSIDLPENLGRFLLLDSLKIKKNMEFMLVP